AEYELRDGNAATILLRLPWDQTPFFAQEVPKFNGLLNIPLSDEDAIRAGGAGLPKRFVTELSRAAYRRTADWQYPVTEQPLAEMPLPDVQGAREIVGRGLSVWTRFQIVTGDLGKAREGILIGLANSRHYGRTPFLVCKLAAAAMANMALDRLEELIQRPEAPNFYWSLTALPTPFLDIRQAFEFEHKMLAKSVPGLDELEKKRSPEEWQDLAGRTVRYALELRGEKVLPEDVAHSQKLIIELARSEVPTRKSADHNFSDAELTVRWIVS